MRDYKELDRMLGSILKDLRQKRGMTMQYVSDRLGLKNRSSIADYESGRTSVDMYRFMKMCELYGVDYRDIMEEIYRSL